MTVDTELYYDLGLYGDDLFEFVLWVEREFGLKPTLNVAEYGPREFPFSSLIRAFGGALGKAPIKYKSLRIRDVLEAIEAKAWVQRR